MKRIIIVAILLVLGGSLNLVFAASVNNGKALFESSKLGKGTTGKSCSSCHNGGTNLGSDIFKRSQFTIMGMGEKSLADVINICIEKPLGGVAIDPDGGEMQDLIAYMKTLIMKPSK